MTQVIQQPLSSSIFTLIFAERPSASNIQNTLNGPHIFATKAEALTKLWGYVHGRIIDCGYDEFLEAFFDGSEEPDFTGHLAADADFDEFFESGCGSLTEQIIDWYFDFFNDETCECFYQIEEHDLQPQAPLLEGIDGRHYQWVERTQTPKVTRYTSVLADPDGLSEFMYKTPEQAMQPILDDDFGVGAQAAQDLVLVRVEKRVVPNPFASDQAESSADKRHYRVECEFNGDWGSDEPLPSINAVMTLTDQSFDEAIIACFAEHGPAATDPEGFDSETGIVRFEDARYIDVTCIPITSDEYLFLANHLQSLG